jgi:hypothetical protein
MTLQCARGEVVLSDVSVEQGGAGYRYLKGLVYGAAQ